MKQTEQIKLIKIEDCNHPMMWYKRYIGEIFTVHKEDLDVYWIREPNCYNALNIVFKEDASEIIPK